MQNNSQTSQKKSLLNTENKEDRIKRRNDKLMIALRENLRRRKEWKGHDHHDHHHDGCCDHDQHN